MKDKEIEMKENNYKGGARKSRPRRTTKRKSNTKNNAPKTKDFSTKDTEYTSETNDFSWYNGNPGMVDNVGRISFGQPIGPTQNIGLNNRNKVVMHTPGICVLDYVHGLGYASNANDAVNSAMFDLYANLRKSQTSYASFDPADYLMYILGISEVYIVYSMIARAYGLLNTYNVESMYQPRRIIEALGFDYDDFLKHQPQYRVLLDSIATRTNVFAVPNVLPYITRQYWMPSGIYSDAATNKHQIYAYRPAIYRTLEETGETGTKLVAHTHSYVDGVKYTYDSMYTVVNNMIESLMKSQDFGVMSANVRLAYGDNVFKLAAFPENYVVLDAHDYNVLAQIENANIMGGVSDVDQLSITQDPGLNKGEIIYAPLLPMPKALQDIVTINTLYDPRTQGNVIVAHTQDTGPEFVMESTRLMATGDTLQGQVRLNCGTEYIAQVTCWVASSGTNFTIGKVVSGATPTVTDCGFINLDTFTVADFTDRLQSLFTFDWFPRVSGLHVEANGNDSYWTKVPLMDLDNYAVISNEQIDQLHYTALLSLFNVKNTKE